MVTYRMMKYLTLLIFLALLRAAGDGAAAADQTATTPIRILSPAGGEQWTLGSVHTISWDTAGLAAGANLQITLISSSGSRYSFVSVPAASGQYEWTVGLPKSALAPGTYQVEVEDPGARGCTNSIPARCWQTVGTSNAFSVVASR